MWYDQYGNQIEPSNEVQYQDGRYVVGNGDLWTQVYENPLGSFQNVFGAGQGYTGQLPGPGNPNAISGMSDAQKLYAFDNNIWPGMAADYGGFDQSKLSAPDKLSLVDYMFSPEWDTSQYGDSPWSSQQYAISQALGNDRAGQLGVDLNNLDYYNNLNKTTAIERGNAGDITFGDMLGSALAVYGIATGLGGLFGNTGLANTGFIDTLGGMTDAMGNVLPSWSGSGIDSSLLNFMDSPSGGGGTTTDWWQQAISPSSNYSVTDLINTALPTDTSLSNLSDAFKIGQSLNGTQQQQQQTATPQATGGFNMKVNPYQVGLLNVQQPQYQNIFGA